jgi:hypothetical protein
MWIFDTWESYWWGKELIVSSEMLPKDYDHKGSVAERIPGREPYRA